MTRRLIHVAIACAAVAALATGPALSREARITARTDAALDANGNLQALIAKHASTYGVPEQLIRRVIHRESRGNPRVISKGNFGLMQIRLGTARAMGYGGTAQGLLDADTNMTYAVKYLAGAYRAAGGNLDRAVHYYAAGYYYAAKRQGLINGRDSSALASLASAAPARAAEARNDFEADASGNAPAPVDIAKGEF